MERKTEEATGSNENMDVGGHRKIGRPKLRWSDVIRKYMKDKQLKIEDAQYRRTCRLTIRCPTPNMEKAVEEEEEEEEEEGEEEEEEEEEKNDEDKCRNAVMGSIALPIH